MSFQTRIIFFFLWSTREKWEILQDFFFMRLKWIETDVSRVKKDTKAPYTCTEIGLFDCWACILFSEIIW